jgi:hypothetical protein
MGKGKKERRRKKGTKEERKKEEGRGFLDRFKLCPQ